MCVWCGVHVPALVHLHQDQPTDEYPSDMDAGKVGAMVQKHQQLDEGVIALSSGEEDFARV